MACKSSSKKSESIPFDNPTEEEADLYNEIISIHDDVMPKMGLITELKDKLKAEKEFISSTEPSNRRKEINSHLSELNKAENGMFDWMNAFSEINELERKEILDFLIRQENDVKIMADQMNSSIASAEEFLTQPLN